MSKRIKKTKEKTKETLWETYLNWVDDGVNNPNPLERAKWCIQYSLFLIIVTGICVLIAFVADYLCVMFYGISVTELLYQVLNTFDIIDYWLTYWLTS